MVPTDVHEAEEMEFGHGPLLWDADPDVCCAAFQLGACGHTEGCDGEDDTSPHPHRTTGDDEIGYDPVVTFEDDGEWF